MPVTTKSTINEGQTGYITMTFTDANNNAVSVSSLTYKLSDNITGNTIAAGNIPRINNNSYTFELTPVMNPIINNNANNEEHVLTIDATYESNKHTTGAFKFDVINLHYHNAPTS